MIDFIDEIIIDNECRKEGKNLGYSIALLNCIHLMYLNINLLEIPTTAKINTLLIVTGFLFLKIKPRIRFSQV